MHFYMCRKTIIKKNDNNNKKILPEDLKNAARILCAFKLQPYHDLNSSYNLGILAAYISY